MANRSNECFPSFSSFDLEFSPGCRVIDNFSEYISFNICRKGNNNKSCKQELDEIVLVNSLSPSVTIIVSDMSIKNNIATSIVYIHTFDKPLMKMIHHGIHVTSTEAELFTIRCGINQSLSVNNISKIVVITDSIHAVKKVFDLSVHPYQTQLAAILLDLRKIIVKPIPSNFGNAQAISNGAFIIKLTKKLKYSILYYSTHVKIHGNSAKRVKVMTY